MIGYFVFFSDIKGWKGKIIKALNKAKNPKTEFIHVAFYCIDDNTLTHYTDKGLEILQFREGVTHKYVLNLLRKAVGNCIYSDIVCVDAERYSATCETLQAIKCKLTWWDAIKWFLNRDAFLCHHFCELIFGWEGTLYTVNLFYYELQLLQNSLRLSYDLPSEFIQDIDTE